LISRNKITKLSKDVASNFDHIFMAGWCLESLRHKTQTHDSFQAEQTYALGQ
jgi:hypothetical protein